MNVFGHRICSLLLHRLIGDGTRTMPGLQFFGQILGRIFGAKRRFFCMNFCRNALRFVWLTYISFHSLGVPWSEVERRRRLLEVSKSQRVKS
jgi:hypothetical protein